MASPITLSPETAYSTKVNIVFPGNDDQRTAANSAAVDRIEDALTGVTVTIDAGLPLPGPNN